MRLYFVLIAAAAVLVSCEKEVQLNLPAHTPALTLSSFTETNERIEIGVGKSISIQQYNRNADLSIGNAIVKVYRDGVLMEEIQGVSSSGHYMSTMTVEPGSTYTVAVSAPGFNTVEASSIAPSQVPLMGEPERIPNVKKDINGVSLDEVRIRFTDPPTLGDFYILQIRDATSFDTTFQYYSSYCITSPDPSVESAYTDDIEQNTCLSSNGIYIKDVLFNGTSKDLRLYMPSEALKPQVIQGDSVWPVILLHHVTGDYFRYLKTYNYALDNSGNPFSEPANVYSNVKNGYGIFSISSYDGKEIK